MYIELCTIITMAIKYPKILDILPKCKYITETHLGNASCLDTTRINNSCLK